MNTTEARTLSSRSPTFVVTDFDLRRLQGLIDVLRARTDDPAIDVLELELELATVVDSKAVPADVVTMNSTVEVLDLDTQETRAFTVVFPGTAAVGAGRVSVLAPVGVALLGARVGDVVSWPAPGGVRRARIERITYQPEAAGDYHL